MNEEQIRITLDILFWAIMVIGAAMLWRSKRVKKTKALLLETEGKQSAEFKIGPTKGFLAEDVLYFIPGNNNLLRKVEWKQAEHVSSYRMNGLCYVKFYSSDGKQVGGISGTLEFTRQNQVEEFYQYVREHAGWIEIR